MSLNTQPMVFGRTPAARLPVPEPSESLESAEPRDADPPFDYVPHSPLAAEVGRVCRHAWTDGYETAQRKSYIGAWRCGFGAGALWIGVTLVLAILVGRQSGWW